VHFVAGHAPARSQYNVIAPVYDALYQQVRRDAENTREAAAWVPFVRPILVGRTLSSIK
jgi:hypothetical protein